MTLNQVGRRSCLGVISGAVVVASLGEYRIVREIGRGGMGVVYEAEQLSLGRRVAIKVLPAHSLFDPRQLGRFQREAKAAGRLHHRNIVPVYGAGHQDGLHYYVMQYIEGFGLDAVLRELQERRALRVASRKDQRSAAGRLQRAVHGRFPVSVKWRARRRSGRLSAADDAGERCDCDVWCDHASGTGCQSEGAATRGKRTNGGACFRRPFARWARIIVSHEKAVLTGGASRKFSCKSPMASHMPMSRAPCTAISSRPT